MKRTNEINLSLSIGANVVRTKMHLVTPLVPTILSVDGKSRNGAFVVIWGHCSKHRVWNKFDWMLDKNEEGIKCVVDDPIS